MKMIAVLIIALSSPSLFAFSTGPDESERTSEIPDRREFPVDPDIDPCTDYFQYACGPALSKFKMREDRSRHIFSFSDSRERILDAKESYLAKLKDKDKFNEKSKQLKDYYLSCTNLDARAKEEKKVLNEAVEKMKEIKSKKEFAQYLTSQSLKGQDSHVGFTNIENLDNSKIYDFIMMPSLMASMPEPSYYKNEELMKEFKEIATEFFKLAGYKDAEKRAQWVVDFEKEYINKYPTPAERRPLWSKRAYSKKSDLLKYKNLQLGKILEKVPGKIKIRNPMDDVFKYQNKAFDKYSLDQLKTVYLFQSTEGALDAGFPDYFEKGFKFSHKYLGGSAKRPELKERCTMDVMNRFNKELDYEVYDSFFPDFPEKKFVALLEKVRASILEGLAKNKWLSNKSKASAMKKIKLARFQVVKPKTEKEWDFNPIADYSPEKYLANQEILDEKLTERNFERLPKPVDKDIWHYGPMTVNAYYDPTANKFVMLAGILQYPFYDPNLPDWVNLGAVGAVVGHELGHGVDDQGSKYDAYGNVKQWMTDKDVETFQSRGKQLVEQFNNAGHDGKLTLGENIGDLVGVTFALNAAKKTMPVDPVAREKATKEFFRQWARAWCGTMLPKREEMQLKTDPHALVWARVNEQMKHQGDFAKVYNCKKGDKLYLPPEKRVSIW